MLRYGRRIDDDTFGDRVSIIENDLRIIDLNFTIIMSLQQRYRYKICFVSDQNSKPSQTRKLVTSTGMVAIISSNSST
jgi:hypothetical protein